MFALKEPVGVVAVITPWNFPARDDRAQDRARAGRGCTVVAKPAEDTPLTSLASSSSPRRRACPPAY
jgi:succinate-semialdehyde dehydrogenase/glutarate-semialdehyde dehydrogenase